MTEAELDQFVSDTAKLNNVLAFHVVNSRRTVTLKGWPDWTLIGPAGILFRENKVQGRVPTPDQRKIGAALRALGQDWDVWRERDWYSGRIRAELTQIA